MIITPKIEALWRAIEHYLDNWDFLEKKDIHNIKVNAEDCALCDLYLVNDVNDYCEECPISEFTGQGGCLGTPWEELSIWVAKSKNNSSPMLEESIKDGFKYLEAEYAFLLEILFREIEYGNQLLSRN